MTRRDLLNLIDELRSGNVSDATSDRCAWAIGWEVNYPPGLGSAPIWYPPGQRTPAQRPPLASSIDAAIAHMVPEGWLYQITQRIDAISRADVFEAQLSGPGPYDGKYAFALTAAGAVCIAGIQIILERMEKPDDA